MALAGIETLHPDVFVIEQAGVPRIIGVGVNTGGFVGVCEKGPLDRSDLVTNLTQFVQKYGGYYQGSYVYPSVKAFFDNGGTRCFIARCIGLGALPASVSLANMESSPSIEANAISAGAWGNDVSLQTLQWASTVAASPAFPVVPPVGNGSTQIPVTSLRGVRRGDLIEISDPVSLNKVKAFVYNIDVGARLLIVRPLAGLPGAFTFPVSSLIRCGSSHRTNTLLDADLVSGATSALLKSTANMTIGARVYFDDGLNFGSAVVTRIDGRIIRFAAIVISAGATLAKDVSIAVSQEFTLRVFVKGLFQEVIDGLSMEPSNTRDYFGARLAGSANESSVISVVDLAPPLVDELMALPYIYNAQPMAGGTEGAGLIDDDYIGSEVAPKTGMWLLDEQTELNFFSIPGITSVVVEKAACDFATGRANIMVILDPPLADDEAMEVLNYRNIELNADTSYAALYFPWVIARDPSLSGGLIPLPPCGFVQGQYAETGITRGVQFAPANVVVRGIVDLTHNTTDGEQDLLNPAGVNVIRSFLGEGIRIWGARTLTSFHDGRHYVNVRRLLNYVKESLKRGLRFAVFELNDQRTWQTVTLACSEFLRSMFLRGQLFSPDGTPDRAFFVKCDAETNPMSEIREGRMNVEIGVNPPLPAEFVIVRLGIWDGGTTIEEELARR